MSHHDTREIKMTDRNAFTYTLHERITQNHDISLFIAQLQQASNDVARAGVSNQAAPCAAIRSPGTQCRNAPSVANSKWIVVGKETA